MALAAVVALAACSQEEPVQPAPDGRAQRLAFTVADGGYAPNSAATPDAADAADAPATRAAENGYATRFTTSDACGLYIVRSGAVVSANVKLTAAAATGAGAGADASLVWTPDEATGALWYTPGDRYFLYYPWQALPQDAPAAGDSFSPSGSGDPDAEFFAALIAAWTPAADQSDYTTGYTVSDLMTAEAAAGTASGGAVPLAFSMTHRMALAVVEFPQTVYKFTDTSIPDYTVPASGVAFTGPAQPFAADGGVYRYLVNPAAAAPTLAGGYGNGSHEFAFALSNLAAGSYKTYKIDGATAIEKSHTLQAGDYFLADGSLLAKDASAEQVAAAEVIGVVFQIDPARIGAAEKAALEGGGSTAHGLVVAAKGPTGTYLWYYKDGNYDRDETTVGIPNILVGTDAAATFRAADADIEGYKYNQILRTHADRKSDYEAGYYPAFKAAADFGNEVAAPTGTTGWYLPSNGQWFDILRGLGGATLTSSDSFVDWDDGDFYWTGRGNISKTLNDAFQHVATTDKTAFGDGTVYWSSSSASSSDARRVLFYSSGDVYCQWYYKYDLYAVRPVLAF